MSRQILLDTGPLVAFISPRDRLIATMTPTNS